MKSVATARGDVNAQRSLAMGVPRNSCYSGKFSNGVNTYTRGNGSGTSRETMRHRRLLPGIGLCVGSLEREFHRQLD